MIGFDELPSRIPDARWRTASRRDPFWGGIWVPRSQAVWVDRRTAMMQRRHRTAFVPGEFLDDEQAAWDNIGHDWDAKMKALAVLDAYRTATAEQIASLTGIDRIAAPEGRILHKLFALGLVDFAEAVSPFRAKRSAAPSHMWRPSVPGRRMRLRLQREMMTYPEWVLASGGMPWTAHRQSSRHDVLTTELLLRAAEFLPQIVGVAGEKFCSTRQVLFESWGREWPLPDQYQGVADAMLVRADGLRILVETTASGASIAERARRYARAMAEGSTRTQGAVVVFVAAARPDADSSVMHDLRTVVRRAVSAYPGDREAPTASRILIADWGSWFPAEGVASEAFMALRAEHFVQGHEGTVDVDLARWEAAVPESAREAALQLAALFQSPWWFRDRAPSLQLAERQTDAVFGGRSPGAERGPSGAVASATVPRRLRS